MSDAPVVMVSLRYFAIYRQKLGRSREQRTVPAGTTVGDLFDLVIG